jgi:RND family efflux transporter MFP subunit
MIERRWVGLDRGVITYGALLVTIGVALGTVACGPPDSAAASDPQAIDTMGVRIVNVGVTAVTPVEFVDYVRLAGEVEALHDVTVSAEESGAISAFALDKGASVRRGQVIARIDDAVLRGQVDEARALVDIADEQFERQRRLWEDEGIGSEIAYLQAKSTASAAAARYRTLAARLARTEIKAPVSGVFDEKYVEVGELVAPGTRVARVVAVKEVKITGGVPERYGLDVVLGDSARITFDVLPGREFVGTISFVGTSVDPNNRTIPIEIRLANPGGVMKPSMLANIQVERVRLADVIVVPQEVVQRTESGYQVFLVGDRDGLSIAVARAVELGASYGNQIVITSGLAVGEPLITTGYRSVDDGSLIRIVDGSVAP